VHWRVKELIKYKYETFWRGPNLWDDLWISRPSKLDKFETSFRFLPLLYFSSCLSSRDSHSQPLPMVQEKGDATSNPLFPGRLDDDVYPSWSSRSDLLWTHWPGVHQQRSVSRLERVLRDTYRVPTEQAL
jgi:hypothetical protein